MWSEALSSYQKVKAGSNESELGVLQTLLFGPILKGKHEKGTIGGGGKGMEMRGL